jgi:hypothetical protein
MVVRLRSTRGKSRVGCLVGILVLMIAGYAGVLVLGSEIDYQQLLSETQTQAGLAGEMDDRTIRETLAGEAAEIGLPVSAEQILIQRFPQRRIQIIIRYTDPIDFFGLWQWVRNRRIQIDQAF